MYLVRISAAYTWFASLVLGLLFLVRLSGSYSRYRSLVHILGHIFASVRSWSWFFIYILGLYSRFTFLGHVPGSYPLVLVSQVLICFMVGVHILPLYYWFMFWVHILGSWFLLHAPTLFPLAHVPGSRFTGLGSGSRSGFNSFIYVLGSYYWFIYLVLGSCFTHLLYSYWLMFRVLGSQVLIVVHG